MDHQSKRQLTTHQILFLDAGHLLHRTPQPTLQLDELVALLVGLVVEGRVGDQGAHVDVTDTVQQQSQILRRQPVQRILRQHIEHSLANGLEEITENVSHM